VPVVLPGGAVSGSDRTWSPRYPKAVLQWQQRAVYLEGLNPEVARRQERTWQFKFSSILAAVMLMLFVGYFIQSFTEIRKVQPVQVAIEHISSTRAGQIPEPVEAQLENTDE
jgi:hypothetical protein